jgi:Tol biopolymer transport system component
MKKRLALGLLLLALALSSCSIQLDQGPVSTALPASTEASISAQGTKIPVTWADLHLTGKLIYIGQGDTVDNVFMTIQMLDLQTGGVSTIFQAPDKAWIYALTVSPDNKQLVMSYAPAPGQGSFGNPALYMLPIDGSQPPQLLFSPPTKDDEYFQPVWSSDNHIYFSHAHYAGPSKNGGQNQDLEVYRMALPDGPPEKIAGQAFWSNISADSKQLVYVSIDPVHGTNKLILANPDGTNAHELAMSGKWVPSYIDAPIFSPDGQAVLFSAVSLSQSQASEPTWLEKLLGITVASAHNVPSDWWSAPVGGGTVMQLTHLQTTGLFASISPDKKHIASYSGYGLFLMDSDGSGLRMLVQDMGGIPSSLNWIP